MVSVRKRQKNRGQWRNVAVQQYAQVCDCENIEKLIMNWINRWKEREEIVCKKLHGEAKSVHQAGVDEWQKYRLPTLLKQLKAGDIFNTDETGLFYRCFSDRTRTFSKLKNALVVNCPRKD